MRMNGEKDEFLFWRVEREKSLSLSFSKGWLVAGEWDQLIVNELQKFDQGR